MKKRYLSFVILFSILSFSIIAQDFEIEDPSKIIPPSPTSSSLGNYGGIDVGLYTGTANISIPVYTLKTKNLSIPISLNYSSSGVKVDQVASWVGMSWNLSVGGVINRTVMDDPDELLRQPLPNFDKLTDEVVNYLNNVADVGIDTQPDVYTYSLPGSSGKFIFSDERNPVLIPLQAISIVETQIDSNKFLITTPDGIKYYFGAGATEYTKNMSTGAGCTSKTELKAPIETSWYLSKIIHPKGDTISFIYEKIGYNYHTGVNQTISELVGYEGSCTTCNPPEMGLKTCYPLMYVSGVFLKEIITNGFGNIVFEESDREDVPGNVKLDSIVVFDSNNEIYKQFKFNYFETNGSGSSLDGYPELNKRFYLSELNEFGTNEDSEPKTHSFVYNNPESLPARLSFSQDLWGYNNGKTNYYFVPETDAYNNVFAVYPSNRDISFSDASKGMLKEIIYPTSGYDLLDYESNSQYKGVLKYPPKTNFNISLVNNDMALLTKVDTFSLPFEQDVEITVGITICPSCPPEEQDKAVATYSIYDISSGDLLTSGLTNNGVGFYETLNLLPGDYEVRLGVKVGDGHVDINYFATEPTIAFENVPVGGLRIKRISTYDGINSQPIIKRYYYNKFSERDQSYAVENAIPNNLSTMMIKSCSGFYSTMYHYAVLNSNSVNSLYSTGSNNIYYPFVTVSNGENFENGGMEYTHKATADIAGYQLPQTGVYSANAPKTNIGFDNGLLVRTRSFKVVDSADVTIKDVLNYYESRDIEDAVQVRGLFVTKLYEECGLFQDQAFHVCQDTADIVKEYYYSKIGHSYLCYEPVFKWMHDKEVVIIPNFCENIGDTIRHYDILSDIAAIEYKYYSDWSVLNYTETKDYDENGLNPVISTTNYQYDPHTHLPNKIESTIGNGNKLVEELHYPTKYIYPADSTCYMDYWAQINSSNLIYNTCSETCIQNSSDEALILCIESCRSEKLDRELTYGSDFNSCLVSSDENYKSILYMQDNYVVTPLIEHNKYIVKANGDTIHSSALLNFFEITENNILNKKSIARLKTSDESSSQYIASYIGDSRDFKYSQDYEEYVSFDRYDENGNMLEYKQIDGITVSILWGYNQLYPVAKIAGATFDQVNSLVDQSVIDSPIDDQTLRDELNKIRQSSTIDALVTTYTYKPQTGITSSTDPNGKTTYYKYDDFGRLKFIKDHEGNLLKKMEYNYKN